MKKITYTMLAAAALMLTACNDWLNVEPKTNVDEDQLYQKEQGFKEALTGVYIKMCDATLYGRDLTYGFMDQIAQRYVNSQNQYADYAQTTWYTYPSTKTEGYTNAFWSGNYNLIANLNNLLRRIGTDGSNIRTAGLRDIITGEALALRGFLYFDLLRMFGPIYSQNAASPSIPYRTQFNSREAKLLPASAVIDSVIADLRQAEIRLEADSMSISFPTYGTDGNSFLSNRFNRMNKYAVKAELARAYQWKGDKASALKYALEVINARRASGKTIFTLVTDNAQDRLLSTELIFALNMDSKTFPDQVTNDFELASWNYYVLMDVNRLYQIFDTSVDGLNDIRIRNGVAFNISSNSAVTLKYSQDNLKSPALKNTMPLIRLAEMYYIAAESAPDLATAARYLNAVRAARGLDDVTLSSEGDRLEQLEKEYRKEFYAEGQIWYFYKRNAYKTFLNCPVASMTEANYRFAVPDDEVLLGNVY
ncbi:MAG: RagB/SusD family nutrient uptake outer membrane protein [Prevotella sp.]|nr:RagB/SusD family nutrient uptake outer membrane protein [Prevotella sp.]MDY4039067.1 RagB/SusD family nutrient uptake outer membrane protein [Prevotella sp.]